MKHVCPYCGHDLEGTELGIHIKEVEDKAANPPSDPNMALLVEELASMKAAMTSPPAPMSVPKFGE